MSLAIRPACPADSALIFALVRDLAEYERLTVEATEKTVADALFCEKPSLHCEIAEWNGDGAGFVTWLLNYSTFRGSHGLYVEDIFVRPAFRGRGIGKALMANLARRCIAEGYSRCEWAVLEWNAPAIAFYKSIGAQILNDWRICRLSDEALAQFAGREIAS